MTPSFIRREHPEKRKTMSRTYTPAQLASLSGVSVRTLHLYDEKGLLPAKRRENGYREYDEAEVDRLQRILQLRATGMRLDQIAHILDDGVCDEIALLEDQRERLLDQMTQLSDIVSNIDATLASLKEGSKMTDEEKFSAFKSRLVEDNETRYGAEARKRWGDEAVDASNKRVMGMTEGEYDRVGRLEKDMSEALRIAMAKGDVGCEEAEKAFQLHREWLRSFWGEGAYTPDAHRGLAQMYVADERFRDYYEKLIGPGATEFLCKVIERYTDD